MEINIGNLELLKIYFDIFKDIEYEDISCFTNCFY
jgi:hypothetical protein